jgi:diaminopimelate epimerase
MKFNFVKYHGLSNDFILIEASVELELTVQQIQRLCHRQTGIGADGIIVYRYEKQFNLLNIVIWNADGTQAEMCGNGVRCVAQHFFSEYLIREIEVQITKLRMHCRQKDSKVEVAMLQPTCVENSLSIELHCDFEKSTILQGSLYTCGNPHFLVRTEELPSIEHLTAYGHHIQRHPYFLKGVNLSFCRLAPSNQLDLIVFERGVGVTQACGSAAAAASCAYLDLSVQVKRATVNLPGGQLVFYKKESSFYMLGPAEYVFSGTFFI